MNNTFTIAATQEEILTSIGEHAALHTATGWRLAAELAAVVRLADGPGRSILNSENWLSTVDIAKLGIRGLKSSNTVDRYVKVWLATHGGAYPEPGQTVTIPDGTFPPEEKNVGTRMPKTPEAIVAKAVAEHGPRAIAEALADKAEGEMLDAVERKTNSRLPGGGRPAPASAVVPTFRGRVLTLCDAIRADIARLGIELDANEVQADTDEERALQHLAADVVTVLGPFSVSTSVEEAMAGWVGDER